VDNIDAGVDGPVTAYVIFDPTQPSLMKDLYDKLVDNTTENRGAIVRDLMLGLGERFQIGKRRVDENGVVSYEPYVTSAGKTITPVPHFNTIIVGKTSELIEE
jgi:hypothetical protein